MVSNSSVPSEITLVKISSLPAELFGLTSPEISFFTEESSEYHKYNIKNYPEHEKIMQQWLSISSNRHKAFEKAVNAKERHLLNLSELVSSDTSLNSNQSEDTVEQLKKLNDLYKSAEEVAPSTS